MKILLGSLAAALLLGYGYYCWHILKARPQGLEQQMMGALAEWMRLRGPGSKTIIWLLFGLSLLLVITYLGLVYAVLANPVIWYITAALIGAEAFHYLATFTRFRRFFAGKTRIMQLFDWKLERLCALLYFGHALLVLYCLFFSL